MKNIKKLKMSQLNGTTDHRSIKLNLDHLYCHPIGDNFIATATANNADVFKIFTENKQLKSMLLLHLDLIQEQSDQLLMKEKNIVQLKQENDALRQTIDRMSQKMRQNKQIKTYSKSGSDNSCDNNRFFDKQQPQSPVSVSPAASVTPTVTREVIVDKELKSEQLLTSLNNNSSSSTNESDEDMKSEINIVSSPPVEIKTVAVQNSNSGGGVVSDGGNYRGAASSIIGVNNGKYINKIVLQKIAQLPPLVSIAIQPTINIAAATITAKPKLSPTTLFSTTDSFLPALEPLLMKEHTENDYILDVKPFLLENILANENNNDTEEEGEEMKNSLVDVEPRYESPINPNEISKKTIEASTQNTKKRKRVSSITSSITQDTEKRVSFKPVITTDHLYVTREWKTDEIDQELQQVQKNLSLEMPTWVVKECTGCYQIEGTEDLCDETFAKRHQKFEIDERRRKKWDVQRIREQRTIERLKRRHYKKEIAEENEENRRKESMFTSFFPSSACIKYIQVTNEIPVQAFGESIPRLCPTAEFSLPWATLPHPPHINITENSGFELIKTRNQKRGFKKHHSRGAALIPPPPPPPLVTTTPAVE